GGRDRGGGGDRQDLLRTRRPGVRQRRARSSAPRGARECRDPMSSAEHLDDLIARLERAAEQLRSGELSSDAAATLVEDWRGLATQAATELEQLTRAQPVEPPPGQDSLL